MSRRTGPDQKEGNGGVHIGFCALGQRPVGLYIRKYFIIRRRPKRISDWGEGEANGIGAMAGTHNGSEDGINGCFLAWRQIVLNKGKRLDGFGTELHVSWIFPSLPSAKRQGEQCDNRTHWKRTQPKVVDDPGSFRCVGRSSVP